MKIIILGAGFAGLTLAWHLLEAGVEGQSISLIDKRIPGSGASGVPGAMMHPVPGRSLAPKPNYLNCYGYSRDWLQSLAEQSNTPFISPIKLWRGAFDSKTALRFQRSYERGQSETGFSELVKEINPKISPYLGYFEALYEVYPAFHVKPALLLKELLTLLKAARVNFHFNTEISPTYKTNGSHWQVKVGQKLLECQQLIFCVANGLLEYFPHLPIEIIRGEALLLEHPLFDEMKHSISSRGYITPIGNQQALAGTSFFPPEVPYNKSESIREILEKVKQIVPFSEEAKVLDIWSGKRTILPPHREPLVGHVPEKSGLYIMSAFATKGWLQIPFSAKQLTQLMIGKEAKIPDNFQTTRLLPSLFKR